MTKGRVVAFLLFVPLASVTAHGQEGAELLPGARVRVSVGAAAPGSRLVGLVQALDGRTLTLQQDTGGRIIVPRDTIRRLDVSLGRGEKRVLEAAGVGLLAGAAGGGLLGLVSGDDPAGTFLSFTAEEKAALGALGLGVVGAAVGAIVGAARPVERWGQVPVNRVRVSLAPARHRGLGLSVSVGF